MWDDSDYDTDDSADADANNDPHCDADERGANGDHKNPKENMGTHFLQSCMEQHFSKP